MNILELDEAQQQTSRLDKEALIGKIHEALGGNGRACMNWGGNELVDCRDKLEAVADILSTATERAEKAERELYAAKTLEGMTDKECDQLREELAASRAAHDKTAIERDEALGQVPWWRDIVSAPRNGQHILVRSPVGILVAFWLSQGHGGCWLVSESRLTLEPTHWMPLPLPPKETT